MFTRYDYKAGSTAVNVLADIAALLAGVTDKATLSADCVQATTVIINDGVARPAGWELWDAAAGANSIALRAPNYDGSTYKYVVLNHNNNADLFLKTYESWNATTHVGTNYVSNSGSYGTKVNLAVGGSLFISASAQAIITIGFVSGIFDASPLLVIEHSRDEPWDTPERNVPPFGFMNATVFTFMNGGDGIYKPRTFYNGLDNLNVNQKAYGPYSSGGYSILASTSPTAKVRDANYNPVHAFCPIIIADSARQMVCGKLFDIFLTTINYGTTGDEAAFNSKDYFIIAAGGSGVRLAVPKY